MVHALPPLEASPTNAIVAADAAKSANGVGASALVPADPKQLAVRTPSDPIKPVDSVAKSSGGSHEQQAQVRKKNLSECCKICVFFTFLVIFTATMLLENAAPSSRLADHIHAKLQGSVVPLATVSSISSFYDYLETGFMPAIFEDSIDTQIASRGSSSMRPLDLSNRILGTVRLRQLRVARSNACQADPMFAAYAISCYPSFAASTESTAAFGDGISGEGIIFEYSFDENGVNYPGFFGSYNPNGFMQLLPANSSAALTELSNLRRHHFLDAATRAVFVEFNVWSSNVAAYAVVSVVVEFGASSAVTQKLDVLTVSERSLVPGGLGFVRDWFAFIGVILVMLFTIWFMIEEIQEVWAYRLNYFFDLWNILDWINMIFIFVGFSMRIMTFLQASSADIGQSALSDQVSFSNLRSIANTAMMANMIHSVNAMLLWGKAAKYLRHIPMVKDLILPVGKVFHLFLPFLFMFLIAFIGFVMAYNIGFGDKVAELSTFHKTSVYLCRAFLRDIKLLPIYDLTTPIFGALLILLFYLTLVLVGASFFFAIIADALFWSKQQIAEKPRNLHTDEPFEECVRALRSMCPWLDKCGLLGMGSRPRGEELTKETPPGEYGPDDKPSSFSVGSKRAGGTSKERRAALPTRAELMRAVELMSGRVLSEISIVGIEIRSELHEVCERVAQMQMAVEELTNRADGIISEQEVDTRR